MLPTLVRRTPLALYIRTPVPNCRMQLTAWLKRHDGRPGVAQSSMSEQLVDVAVTSSREAESAAYEVGGRVSWCGFVA